MATSTALGLLAAVETWMPPQPITRDFVIAFAAAFAGAWGAQNIAERRKRHVDLTAELRETNAGVALTATVFTVLANLKSQHVAALWGNFRLTKATVEYQRNLPQGQRRELRVGFDMKTISMPTLPLDRLRSIVFEKISISGRPIQLASMLFSEIEELQISCLRRNEIIAAFRELNDRQKIERYFGFRDAEGNVDENFPNTIEAIYLGVDACMFFSWLLSRDLSRHSKSVALSLRRWPWQRLKNVHYADFRPPKSVI